jgi:CheY-like chemotaxis protein
MINDVLDMNHIESGEVVLKAEPFAPADLLNLVNVLARLLCEEKGLEYRHEVVGELEAQCVGDSLRLRQVLLSILSNAVKFTPEGGRVCFVTTQLPREGDRCVLRFTISDTGVGIDESFMPRLFDSFAQEDATATNRYGGSGLGLAITKKLVEMMDGDIAVESRKGEGSTFTVTVRLGTMETAQAETPDAGEKPSLAGRHMLIVEDIDLNADLLADLLELEDITTERAENGRAAVDAFARAPQGHFDAILMDLRMPVMDGLEAARAIRALPRPDAGTVPIIALTANAFEEDVRQSLDAGMNAHLSKPVDTDLLYDTLRRLVA